MFEEFMISIVSKLKNLSMIVTKSNIIFWYVKLTTFFLKIIVFSNAYLYVIKI